MKIVVDIAALEHLALTVYREVDIYDDSRHPELLATMIKICEALAGSGSPLTFGRYPERNLQEQIAWMKEHLLSLIHI